MSVYDFDHARRVAARVLTSDEKLVALLHDAVEDGNLSKTEMNEMLGENAILEAVRLLTRADKVGYDDYIARIDQAPGYPGALARAVKIADLTENLSRMDKAHESNRARYGRALVLLRRHRAASVQSS